MSVPQSRTEWHRLAADLRCDIQVAHYPPGCSKYNPIEHRLFCHVSRAIQAIVLKTIQVARDFIARTQRATRVLAEGDAVLLFQPIVGG